MHTLPLLLCGWTVLQEVEQISSLNESIFHEATLVTSAPIKKPFRGHIRIYFLTLFYVHLHPHEGTFEVAGAQRATADSKTVVQEEVPTRSGPRHPSAGAVAAVLNSKL